MSPSHFFFAITSIKPDGKHFFLGDWDNCVSGSPAVFEDEFLIMTKPNHYHVINFNKAISLNELIKEQTVRNCDPSFIRATKAYGFAQLTLHGKILKEGKTPFYPIRLCHYNDCRKKSSMQNFI